MKGHKDKETNIKRHRDTPTAPTDQQTDGLIG